MIIYGSFYLIYLAVYWYYYFYSKRVSLDFTKLKSLAIIETRLNLSISIFFAFSTVIITLLVSVSVFRLLTLMYLEIKSGEAGVCGFIYHFYDNFYSRPSGIVI